MRNDNTSKDKVILVSLQDNDYLDEELGVCVSNTFETFEDVKTLVISDESTLEIRADSQSQTGEEFLAEGMLRPKDSDMLKADKIKYYTDTKNVSASGNVGYFNEEFQYILNLLNTKVWIVISHFLKLSILEIKIQAQDYLRKLF